MDQVYMIWAVVAAALIIAEIFSASFAAVWFGIGAIFASVISYFNIGGDQYTIGLQWVAFILVSILLFLLFRKKLLNINSKTVNNFGVDRLLGCVGVVTEEINNITGSGRIEVEGENWLAASKNDVDIEVGEKVVVSKISGTRLIVIHVKE